MNKQELYDTLVKNAISIPVITVVLTAILGPIAVNWINSSMKEKEIQRQVITSVLEYTNNADFSQNESLTKIGLIANMVDENNHIFNLKFEKSKMAFEDIYKKREAFGLTESQKNLQSNKEELIVLKSKTAKDSLRLQNVISFRNKLTKQLTDLKSNKEYNDAEREKVENELISQITSEKRLVEQLAGSVETNKTDLYNLETQKRNIEDNLVTLQNEFDLVTTKNREHLELLHGQQEALANEKLTTSQLREKLNSRMNELEKALSTINNLNIEITVINVEHKKTQDALLVAINEICQHDIEDAVIESSATDPEHSDIYH